MKIIRLLSLALVTTALHAEVIPTLRPPNDPVNYWVDTVANRFRSDVQSGTYTPDYQPGVVDFDLKGRPFMRRGSKVYSVNAANNGWEQRSDLSTVVKAAYPNWNGALKTGLYADEHVLFDTAGHAYTFMETSWRNHNTQSNSLNGYSIIMLSTDGCRTWKLTTIPITNPDGANTVWQIQDQNTNYNLPPALVIQVDGAGVVNNNRLEVANIAKNGTGSAATLSVNKIGLPVTAGSFGPIGHSGGSQLCSYGNNYYLAWHSRTAGTQLAASPQVTTGTACYITTINRTTGANSGASFLGYAGNTIDAHNLPAITTTSDGRVWAVMLGHQENRMYSRRATAAGSTATFDAPEYFSTTSEAGGKTYASLVCGRYDGLHLAFRYLTQSSISCVGYCKKDVGTAWSTISRLVVTDRAHYQAFSTHLTFSKARNMICLSFDDFADTLKLTEYNAYVGTWPQDNVQAEGPPPVGGTKDYNNTQHHWPAILVSDNGGAVWDIPNNNRFFSGIAP